MRIPWIGLLLTMVPACGPTLDATDTGGASSSTTSPGMTTTSSTTLPPTTRPTDTSPGSSDEWGGFFDDGLFVADVPTNCNPLEQDCPPGAKCMPWVYDGNGWSDTHCVPIVPDPDAVGEPCTSETTRDGVMDTCELGSMCWYVDPMTGEGTCLAFCIGTSRDVTCADPQSYCHVIDTPLCRPWCDPLAPNCADAEICVPVTDEFECAPDASGGMGAPGDPCEFINTCAPGSLCTSMDLVPGCTNAAGCCSSWCALDDPMPPCLPGQECMPWYGPGMAPPHHANLGACMLP